MAIDPEKLHQVAALTALGKSTREIEPIVGADHTTISRYLKRNDVQQLIAEHGPAITARLSERMWDLVDSESFQVPPQTLAVMWGIAMDKHAKMSGQGNSGVNITINVDRRSLNLNTEPE